MGFSEVPLQLTARTWVLAGCFPRPDPESLAAAGHAAELCSMDEPRNIKSDARLLVDALPDSATWDDLAYEIYVRQAIERGLADSDAGRVVGHEDALARIRARIRRAS